VAGPVVREHGTRSAEGDPAAPAGGVRVALVTKRPAWVP
jgi:hypothetical protein